MTDTTPIQNLATSFSQYFRALEAEYADIGGAGMFSAFSRTGFYNAYTNNPWVQNTRVKKDSSLPVNYGKDKISEMLLNPDGSELPLRQVANALEYTAYPFFKLRKTYQDILTYRHYSYPCYLTEAEAKRGDFLREWRLVEKISEAIKPAQMAHQIAGECIRDGKVFYTLRSSVDKAHNAVNHAFLQQMPQDWVKIVGFNNVSKYTIAFNMMYFLQPGTTVEQFGNMFDPYMADFAGVVKKIPKDAGTKIIYASSPLDAYGNSAAAVQNVDWGKMNELRNNGAGKPEVYYQSGQWFYWVTLPVDAVWTFECDDVWRNVVSPMAGLILSMAQIAQYENVQLELVQNPLVSVLTGEIPYSDNAAPDAADPYKLSPTGRKFWEYLWYQMLAANNTSGIGLYLAPAENLKLQQLAESPSATEISANGYAYTMMKSGSGIIPTSSEPRVGAVNISAQIESQFARGIYDTFANMMNWLYANLNLRYDWRFRMFGDIFSEEKEKESCRKGMTLGILQDSLKYSALCGHSILDDLSISNAVIGLGIMNKRIPLVTSYTAKNPDSGLPPTAGRPPVESGDVETEGSEAGLDSEE